MRFTLTYEGPLPPKQKGISRVKRDLRQAFHPQLVEQIRRFFPEWPEWQPLSERPSRLELGGVQYDSIVTAYLRNAVELDILLLTPTHLSRPGDNDNRVKTLLDGLSRPTVAELADQEATEPILTLLEDDSLVRRYSCDSRPWLGRSADERASLAVITVTIINDGPSTLGGMFLAS